MTQPIRNGSLSGLFLDADITILEKSVGFLSFFIFLCTHFFFYEFKFGNMQLSAGLICLHLCKYATGSASSTQLKGLYGMGALESAMMSLCGEY